jgi:hypothetical protein
MNFAFQTATFVQLVTENLVQANHDSTLLAARLYMARMDQHEECNTPPQPQNRQQSGSWCSHGAQGGLL